MNGCFTHQLLPYDSVESFVTGTVPFVRSGLEGGDAVLAVTSVVNHELLRDALGGAADEVEFIEAAEWYRHPARTLAGCLSHAEQLAREGRRLRLLGEPVWRDRTPLEVTEWQRVEALANVAFAGTDAAILCPYNGRMLPAGIVAGARRTHPETVHGASPVPNPGYMDPWAFNSLFDERPLGTVPAHAEELVIEVPDLYWLRAYIADYTRGGVLPDAELQRLLVAVTEVVTNAQRHGVPPIVLRLWTEPGELVCEVSDGGSWRSATGHGRLPPDPAGPGRFGLWAVRLLCSVVQIRSDESGTTVRLRLPAVVPA